MNSAINNLENFETADVTLPQMLSLREEKEAAQNALLSRFPGGIVISLGMNIPGPQKNNNRIAVAFQAGVETLDDLFLQQGIQVSWKSTMSKQAGNVALYALCGGDAQELKEYMIALEETHPLGRLFDIDVYTKGGAVSRGALGFPQRKCLLCNHSAKACGRSRTHSPEKLMGKVYEIISQFNGAAMEGGSARETGGIRQKCEDYGRLLARRAKHALPEEVYTGPKPGLVDPFSNGAHTDMCLNTFELSAQALEPYFEEMAELGFRMPEDPQRLFQKIREVGVRAEAAMYCATGRVNTHKGAIFSLGILCAAAGACRRIGRKVSLTQLIQFEQAMIREPLTQEIQMIRAREPQSHGEKVLKNYSITGIRGEAINGFASARELALPVLRAGLRAKREWNLVKLQALFTLMSRVEDSNVLFRCGLLGMREVQGIAQEFLNQGGHMRRMQWKSCGN